MRAPFEAYLGRVQALRFFAALAVLIGHVQHEVATRLMIGLPFSGINFIDGGLGVDVFFLISGFIMFHTVGEKFGSYEVAKSFALRRFLRVSPLYYLSTMLLIFVMTISPDKLRSGSARMRDVIYSLCFIPYINGESNIAPILKLGWTLNYEMYFYSVFSLALVLPKRYGVASLFLFILLIVAAAAALPGRATILDFWGNSIVCEFLAGVIIAMLFRAGVSLTVVQSCVMILCGLLIATILRVEGLIYLLPRCVYHGVPASLIVAGVVFGPLDRGRGPVLRMLEVGGDASYALYLFHPFAIRGTTVLWQIAHGPRVPVLFCLVVILCALIAAVAINRLVERPLDQWLRKKLGPQKTPLAVLV